MQWKCVAAHTNLERRFSICWSAARQFDWN